MSTIRDRIMQFTAQPVRHESAELGTVYIRRLTLGELDRLQGEEAKQATVGDRPIPTTVRLLARFVGDEAGKPVFDLSVPADLEALLAWPVGLAAEVLRWGQADNKMDEERVPGKT